jgi:nuclear transport factor 2 (NTF2) superfamily protein
MRIQVSALSVASTLTGITMKMKNSMNEIIEYTREYGDGTEQTMYKSKWMNREYHSANREDIVEWLEDKVTNVEKYKLMRELEDKAITSFFEGTTTSKD